MIDSFEKRGSSPDVMTQSDLMFNTEVRRKFISKVYSILTTQLIITVVISFLFTMMPDVRGFIKHHPFLIYLPMLFITPIYFALMCCQNVRRSYPLNFILLGILTLGYSCILGILSVMVSPTNLITAYIVTSVLFFSMTILARANLIDMTKFWLVLFVAGLSLIVIIIVVAALNALFGVHLKVLNLVVIGCSILLLLAYIVYDTQMILGGRSIELNEEDYIYAVLCLYCDVIQLLINVIALFETLQRDN